MNEPLGKKDTVFVSAPVPGGSGHVEQHQLSALRLVHHHLVQLDGRVHAPHVGLVPGGTGGSGDAGDGDKDVPTHQRSFLLLAPRVQVRKSNRDMLEKH